jgi:hypothetical protein
LLCCKHSTGVSIAINPVNPATIYAATNGGGVFNTTTGGSSWTAVNSGLTDTFMNFVVMSGPNEDGQSAGHFNVGGTSANQNES